jgi:hypothetical protein
MTARPLASLVLVAALLSAAARPAPCDDVASPVAAARPVNFVAGLDAGRTAAAQRGVPLLVYVHSDRCPVCQGLDEEVFAKPESGRIESACVPVRIESGEIPAAPAAEFMRRYDVRGYPALLVLTADGDVVVPAAGRTLPEMLAALGRVPGDEAALAKARRDAESGDEAPLLELLWRRMSWDEFLRRAAPRADTDPLLGARVATALLRTGRTAESRAAWRRLAERFPSHEDRPEWLVREAACDLDAAAGARAYQARLVPTIAALRDLGEKLGRGGDGPGAARAWIEVGRLEAASGIDFGAICYFDKAIAAAPGTRFEATALWDRHSSQFRVRRYADARESCARIVRDFPASPEAKLAPAEIEKCDEMTGR